MTINPQFEALAHPDLIRLARHCEELAGLSDMPHREEFNPGPVLRYLPGRLYLVDVLDGGADYRFRLFGMFWQTIYGRNLAGLKLSDIEAAGQLLALRPHYDTCLAKRAPVFLPGKLIWQNRHAISFQRLLIPFAEGEGNVSMLLCAAYCDISQDDLCLFQGSGIPKLVFDKEAHPHAPETSYDIDAPDEG